MSTIIEVDVDFLKQFVNPGDYEIELDDGSDIVICTITDEGLRELDVNNVQYDILD
jgi:hypothetical protein